MLIGAASKAGTVLREHFAVLQLARTFDRPLEPRRLFVGAFFPRLHAWAIFRVPAMIGESTSMSKAGAR
jgi:hypothetical protein